MSTAYVLRLSLAAQQGAPKLHRGVEPWPQLRSHVGPKRGKSGMACKALSHLPSSLEHHAAACREVLPRDADLPERAKSSLPLTALRLRQDAWACAEASWLPFSSREGLSLPRVSGWECPL